MYAYRCPIQHEIFVSHFFPFYVIPEANQDHGYYDHIFHPITKPQVPIERSRQELSKNRRTIAISQRVLELFVKNL